VSKLFRICLDFRELNEVLEFTQQTSFTTIDEILMKLKGKKVISLDISSAFFIIPIQEKDRYKTAFWVNQDAYEFCCLVMGLKSSPYHLVKFMAIAFSQQVFDKIKATLTPEEQRLLPASFEQMMSAYLNEKFVFWDTFQELYVALKVLLMAATEAKIKFSSEKSKFFTTNVKVLGYSFDTSNVQLTMDKVKASGIMNTKKPSSLYELHSRLASFQYQSMFLPYLKHILYPLNFLPRIILYIKNCRPGMFIRILIFTHPRSRGCMHSTVLSFGAEIQPKNLVFRYLRFLPGFSLVLCFFPHPMHSRY
jgi:hypothetical protein